MNTIKHGRAMLCCKLMLQIDSLHKKGAHNQCNFTVYLGYSIKYIVSTNNYNIESDMKL